MRKRRNTSFWLYAIGSYILIQFFWWAWLLVSQNTEEDLSRRILMVTGEGVVFLLLLFLGFRKLRKSIELEVNLAHTQQNFLLSVTHELNTPLATIKLYLQTILKRDLEKTQIDEILQNSISETDRLKGLVDNILTSARIDENELKLHASKQNLGDLVQKLLSPKTAHEGYNRIKTQIKNDVYCQLDPLAIASILQNLLDNAIKYDPSKKEIVVVVDLVNDYAILEVRDQGLGVSANQKDEIFQKFYRIQSEKTRSTKGTGLGLFIVRNLVELQNGEIEHLDNSPIGSIFNIKFPPII